MATWEYAALYFWRQARTATEEWPVSAAVYLPNVSGPQQLETTDTLVALNDLGREGWELVGSPTTRNIVGQYSDPERDLVGDQAMWLEKTYWLKRAVDR